MLYAVRGLRIKIALPLTGARISSVTQLEFVVVEAINGIPSGRNETPRSRTDQRNETTLSVPEFYYVQESEWQMFY